MGATLGTLQVDVSRQLDGFQGTPFCSHGVSRVVSGWCSGVLGTERCGAKVAGWSSHKPRDAHFQNLGLGRLKTSALIDGFG